MSNSVENGTRVDREPMKIEFVSVDDLVHDPRNARKGHVASIAESLREFGQHRPIVARRENNQVIVGNHMLKAAKSLGWKEVAVVFVDDTEETAIRRAIADNATGDKATWDNEKLVELFREVGAVPGFDDRAVKNLFKSFEEVEKVEPIYPILAKPNEEYDFVMIVAETEMDAAYLRTKFQLREEKSYKRDFVSRAHVISVTRLQEILDDE